MAKSRARRPSSKPLYAILGLSLFIALAYVGFRTLYPPQPSSIFLISPTLLEYGDTTVSGTLRKDSPVGQDGNYLLILDDSRPVLLDVKGIDNLLGQYVSVQGTLLPPESGDIGYMIVTQVSTK